MQNLEFVGATVIEFHFFNQIKKKKTCRIYENYFYEYHTQIFDTSYFHGDLHLGVSELN